MIANNFVFKGPFEQRLDQNNLPDIEDIASVEVEWRYQKNCANGQKIPYTKNTVNPSLCGVLAAYRIRQRARRLKIPAHHPMGVHRNCDSDKVLFITGDNAAEFLQQIASDVYGLSWGRTKDAKVLNKYLAHSIRVTAANLLHRAGMSDSYI